MPMTLTLIQDTREKENQHNNIVKYCQQHHIPILRKVLDVGDYRLANVDSGGNIHFINNISVDIKGSGDGIIELAKDLYKDSQAFNKKYRKCYRQGIKLIVLVEKELHSLNDLVTWRSPHTKVNGRMLLDMIHTLKVSYGINFFFCDKSKSGYNLINLLSGNNIKSEV